MAVDGGVGVDLGVLGAAGLLLLDQALCQALQPEAVCQRMRQRGLAHAGNVFQQQVSPGQQAGHTVADLSRFPYNHRVKLIQKRLTRLAHSDVSAMFFLG